MSDIVLIDDSRTFRADVVHDRARTSAQGLAALARLRALPGAQLWLDHDLGVVDGEKDTILPVLDELARAASDGDPYPVGQVVIHTTNPEGAATIARVLSRWGYPHVRVHCGDHLREDA